jgi:XTP/dITP diphosphohydrolase
VTVRVLVGTSSKHKLGELAKMAAGLDVEVVPPSFLDTPLPPVVEDGATFADNARKKAVAYARATGLPCIADDSGLSVDALGGAPGVLSARYAGDENAPDRDERNNARLLAELAGVPPERRAAHYTCALCLALPTGEEALVEGEWHGWIGRTPKGTHGFGYDPLFVVDPATGQTAAQLSPEEKNRQSHRGAAMAKLRPVLEAFARDGRLPA